MAARARLGTAPEAPPPGRVGPPPPYREGGAAPHPKRREAAAGFQAPGGAHGGERTPDKPCSPPSPHKRLRSSSGPSRPRQHRRGSSAWINRLSFNVRVTRSVQRVRKVTRWVGAALPARSGQGAVPLRLGVLALDSPRVQAPARGPSGRSPPPARRPQRLPRAVSGRPRPRAAQRLPSLGSSKINDVQASRLPWVLCASGVTRSLGRLVTRRGCCTRRPPRGSCTMEPAGDSAGRACSGPVVCVAAACGRRGPG